MTTAEIDWAARAPITMSGSRTCRACARLYKVPIGYAGPPLCDGCRVDLGLTRLRVQAWLAGIDTQIDAANQTWLDLATQHADAWDRIRASQALPDYAARCASHRARGTAYGQLLDALEQRDRALTRLGDERERLSRALASLDD